MKKIEEETFKYVEEVLMNDFTGHDINHIKRVYKIACEIVEGINCNKEVVKLAAILHDIDDPKITKDYNGDCTKARKFLSTKVDLMTTNEICDIINNMSYSKNKEKKQNLTLEGQIVQDADRIDAIGAIGIARTFQYGGANKRDMLNSFEHFDDKLVKLYDLINTEEAKKIAKERHDFLMMFYKQFKKEWQ